MNAPAPLLNHGVATYLELRKRISMIYELNEDDPVLADTVDGETDLTEQIAAVLRESKATDAMAEGLASLMDAMQARKVRLEAKAKNLRSAALWALQETGQTKLKVPDMTVSVMPGKPTMVIDLLRLPGDFKITVATFAADRPRIQEAVDSGDVPEGVEVVAPVPFLTIRTR